MKKNFFTTNTNTKYTQKFTVYGEISLPIALTINSILKIIEKHLAKTLSTNI